MSLIRIGCRLSSSLSDALVPMSPGLSWLVGPVAFFFFFLIFEYVTTGPFGGPLSVDFTHVQKLDNDFQPFVF